MTSLVRAAEPDAPANVKPRTVALRDGSRLTFDRTAEVWRAILITPPTDKLPGERTPTYRATSLYLRDAVGMTFTDAGLNVHLEAVLLYLVDLEMVAA